jgi:hypothetical protein
MNGIGMPIAGKSPFAIITFTHVWPPIHTASPESTKAPN